MCKHVHIYDGWRENARWSATISVIQRMAVIAAKIPFDVSWVLSIGLYVSLHPDYFLLIASAMQALMLTIAAGFWCALIVATCLR